MSADGGRTLGLCHQLPSGRCVVLFPLGAIATDPHGLVHELVHSFGLCGIPMVDEGLAVLVERLAAEGFTPDALEDPHCAAAAGRIATSGRGARDIFTTGSAYLAGYLVAGWPELAREFDRLSAMAREQATARIRDGTAAGPLPEAERPAGDGDARNDMAADCGAAYFRGDFETLYRLVRDVPMPADEYRRNLARLHCVQANDDTGRHAHWDLPAPQGGPPPPGIDIFIDLVGRFAAMRTTRSREAFIEEARQSFDLIARLGGCAGMEIDALVLEIQSRRALPAFAGGSCDKALAACNELETTWRRPGLAERFRRAIEAER